MKVSKIRYYSTDIFINCFRDSRFSIYQFTVPWRVIFFYIKGAPFGHLCALLWNFHWACLRAWLDLLCGHFQLIFEYSWIPALLTLVIVMKSGPKKTLLTPSIRNNCLLKKQGGEMGKNAPNPTNWVLILTINNMVNPTISSTEKNPKTWWTWR